MSIPAPRSLVHSHDPLTCGLSPELDCPDCQRARERAELRQDRQDRRRQRRRETRPDAIRLRQLIRDHPRLIMPAILDMLTDDITDIALAVTREVHHGQ